MKHPKWLLIGVIVLLVINIVFYTVWYAYDVQGKVNKRLEAYLSKTLQGTVTIQKLSINDRHLTANNIEFIDKAKNTHLYIKQIQVRYNLLRILTSGFKINKAINQITVFEPKMALRYSVKHEKPVKIPDLTPYFRSLEIKNGSLDITFSTPLNSSVIPTKAGTGILPVSNEKITHLELSDRLRDINLSINNHKASEIRCTASGRKGGTFFIQSSLDRGLLTKAKLQISQYQPLSIKLSGFERIATELSILVNYQKVNRNAPPEYDLNSIVWNTDIAYKGYTLHAPYMHFNGNQDRVEYEIRSSQIKGKSRNLFSSHGSIFNPLKQLSVQSTIDIAGFGLNEISPDLKGEASGKLTISGSPDKFTASGNLRLPSMSYGNEIITDLSIDAKYSADSLHFVTNDFLWRNQTAQGSGFYNIKSKSLGVDITTTPGADNQSFRLESDLGALVDFNKTGIKADIEVRNLSIGSDYATVQDIHGKAQLRNNFPENNNTLIDLSLENSQGLSLTLSGDLTTLNLKSVVALDSVFTHDYSPYLTKQKVDSSVSGKIITELNGNAVSGNCLLAINMLSPQILRTNISSDYNYLLNGNSGNLTFATDDGYLNNLPFNLRFNVKEDGNHIKLSDFNLDNTVWLDGWINRHYASDYGFQIKADSVSFIQYWQMFSQIAPPLSTKLSFDLNYNYNQNKLVKGFIKADSCAISLNGGQALKPFNSLITILGKTDKVELKTDIITSESSKLSIQSSVSHSLDWAFAVKGILSNFLLQDILPDAKTHGALNGTAGWTLQTKTTKKSDNTFFVDIRGNNILYQGFPVDSLNVNITQSNDLLRVDNVRLLVGEYFKLTGKGSLDYNILTNNYDNGNHYLNLSLDGDVLKWLDRKSKYIENAKGKVSCQLAIKSSEDGLIVENGVLSLNRGTVKLKDQVETITNINIQGRITRNELKLDKFSCQVGEGKLYIRNEIDPGGDNFYIGPLNLGYFLLRTDENGIQATMPDYMPSNTVATAVLKGQNGKEATIKGPFDDMEIKGEILCSNGSAVYPAFTKNLMQLLNFFRQPTLLPEALPLPMTVDLLLVIKDNVHYVTYPANLRCLPESYLRVVYDGTTWGVPEAEFQSEQGTLDFYGSIFNVEFIKLVINLQQQITALNGTFIRKAPDGTLVTLTVSTNLQKPGDLFNQLEFSLASDNPEDRTPAQILSRLRYNRNIDELSPDQRQSLLQDEAMQVIGTSVSTTYISGWLSPVENSIRKFLKLDNFSISTGFIQNLYLQYRTKGTESASFSNPKNLNADIMQFSSSVILNNLSLSMGKYLGKGVYLDYQVQMQEATDLAQKTKLVFYHDTSLRFNLPWKFRLAYTFSLRPLREPNAHEIMLQRSFRF